MWNYHLMTPLKNNKIHEKWYLPITQVKLTKFIYLLNKK